MAEVSAGKYIGTHKELTDFDRSLLWVMTGYLHYGGMIKVQQKQLASDVGSSPGQISRSVARLIEAEVIERKGQGKFKLNSHIGQMGARLRKSDIAKAKGWSTIEGGEP